MCIVECADTLRFSCESFLKAIFSIYNSLDSTEYAQRSRAS